MGTLRGKSTLYCRSAHFAYFDWPSHSTFDVNVMQSPRLILHVSPFWSVWRHNLLCAWYLLLFFLSLFLLLLLPPPPPHEFNDGQEVCTQNLTTLSAKGKEKIKTNMREVQPCRQLSLTEKKPKFGSPRNKKSFYANFVTSVKWLPLFLFLSGKSIKVRRALWTKLFHIIWAVCVWMSCFPEGCVFLPKCLAFPSKTSARWDPVSSGCVLKYIQRVLLPWMASRTYDIF